MAVETSFCYACGKAKECIYYTGEGNYCRSCTNELERAEKLCIKRIKQKTKQGKCQS